MRHTPSLLDMIGGLIGTPSISCVDPALDQGNRAVIDLLAVWLESAGFVVEVMPLPGTPAKANLIATLGSGPGGLVLAGHTDTVPYDQGAWRFDPFRLTEADQRLYGLGTSDMKAFLALTIEACRGLRAAELHEPLVILATADEETSMSGARALVERQRPHARHAVIGEPTGLRPVRMHKGIFMERIRLHGHAGHSSNPALGNSALEAMHRVIGSILAWRDELQTRYNNPLFAVPVPTLNLGHIHGGDNPNRICADCELQLDLRPLPGMDVHELRGELHRHVTEALADSGIEIHFDALFEGIPAMETAAAAPIVRLAERLTGHTPEAVAFATEAPYLKQLGMDTIILGPGNIEQAHQPDEYLALDRLQPTVDLLRRMIKSVCIDTDPLL
ncbi:MAG TPA: acetylornithine deacetylase [Gammaproteobacteria bacterium]|nr:acetylornithine deacetylase [Gammaproteobacteria bacterium]